MVLQGELLGGQRLQSNIYIYIYIYIYIAGAEVRTIHIHYRWVYHKWVFKMSAGKAAGRPVAAVCIITHTHTHTHIYIYIYCNIVSAYLKYPQAKLLGGLGLQSVLITDGEKNRQSLQGLQNIYIHTYSVCVLISDCEKNH
jgi:hypothetical protein